MIHPSSLADRYRDFAECPLDVTGDEAMDWLTMLVWPEQQDRRQRLTEAITIARQDPPALTAGNLLDTLPQQIEVAAQHGLVLDLYRAQNALVNAVSSVHEGLSDWTEPLVDQARQLLSSSA